MSSSKPPSFFKLALKSVLFWVGGTFLLVGLPFLLVGLGLWWYQSANDEALAERALTSEAAILARSVDRSNRPARYVVDFRFVTADGETIFGSASLSQAVWAELPPESGATIAVHYLPEDPTVYSVPGEANPYILGYVFSGLGGLFTILGGILFWISVRGMLLFRRLWQEGMPARAEIVEVVPTSMRINRVRQWRIHYRYHDAMGGSHQGKSPYLSPEKAQQWKVGDEGEIRFDARQPSLSAWIER